MAVGKRSSERALQKVLGKGANVNEANPLEVHDPKVGSLISYEGTTTADGAGDGSTLIDSVLATKPDYDGQWVVITSGPYFGQCSDITGATTGGTVTAHEAFDGQIVSRTKFVILAMKALPAEVAALAAALAAHEAAQLVSRGEVTSIETKVDDLDADLVAHEAALAAHEAAQLVSRAALGTHDTDIKALLATIAGYIDAEIVAIITSQGKMLFTMDFWSLPQEEVALTVAAADKALPSVSVADLPGGATIVRAIAMFKFRMVENHTYAGENKLDGAQAIQVAGSVPAINFVDTQFTLAETTREGGDVVVGAIDIAATVSANGAYAFHWDLSKAIQTGINFNDVQMGIRIWYSV